MAVPAFPDMGQVRRYATHLRYAGGVRVPPSPVLPVGSGSPVHLADEQGRQAAHVCSHPHVGGTPGGLGTPGPPSVFSREEKG